MKNISVISLLILIIGTGCSKFPSHKDITVIYYQNKELINRIKDGFFSSGFIPNKDGNGVILYYDYNNGQLLCQDDTKGEILQSIQNVHSDAIEYFQRMNRNFSPRIDFSKIPYKEDIMVQFRFHGGRGYSGGFVYTDVIKQNQWIWGNTVHLEDNWYAFRYRFTE